MPVFIAFAAFLLLVFGHRLGLPIGPWVVTTGPFGNKRKTPGQKSGVRTELLDMVLDHDTGRMEGPLSQRSICRKRGIAAARGVALHRLEAFLDRRSRGWRKRADAHAKTERKSPRSGSMTAIVLGLKPGAKHDEIRAAHRRLMMKFHPDQGGSTYLAARINEAKEILLSK